MIDCILQFTRVLDIISSLFFFRRRIIIFTWKNDVHDFVSLKF